MSDINISKNYPTQSEIDNAFDKNNFKKIHDKAFVYNHFLNDNFCNELVEKMLSGQYKIYHNNGLRFYDTPVDEEVKNMITKISSPWIANAGFSFMQIEENSWLGDHRDGDYKIPGWHLWGGVLYLTDFEGGDVVYPDQDVRFHGKKGDLLFHTGDTPHYVDYVKSKNRYIITFYLWKEDKQ